MMLQLDVLHEVNKTICHMEPLKSKRHVEDCAGKAKDSQYRCSNNEQQVFRLILEGRASAEAHLMVL